MKKSKKNNSLGLESEILDGGEGSSLCKKIKPIKSRSGKVKSEKLRGSKDSAENLKKQALALINDRKVFRNFLEAEKALDLLVRARKLGALGLKHPLVFLSKNVFLCFLIGEGFSLAYDWMKNLKKHGLLSEISCHYDIALTSMWRLFADSFETEVNFTVNSYDKLINLPLEMIFNIISMIKDEGHSLNLFCEILNLLASDLIKANESSEKIKFLYTFSAFCGNQYAKDILDFHFSISSEVSLEDLKERYSMLIPQNIIS